MAPKRLDFELVKRVQGSAVRVGVVGSGLRLQDFGFSICERAFAWLDGVFCGLYRKASGFWATAYAYAVQDP